MPVRWNLVIGQAASANALAFIKPFGAEQAGKVRSASDQRGLPNRCKGRKLDDGIEREKYGADTKVS